MNPVWRTPLLSSLFACLVFGASVEARDFSVRDFGAKGDGLSLDTEAINRAIAAASAEGGGTVVFPAGTYASHTIRLKSRICLRLDPGSVLLAAEPPKDGHGPGYDAPEPNRWEWYQDFGHSHWKNSLIWGEGLEDVSIIGSGRIYGKGLSRGNGAVALPVGKFYAGPQLPPGVLEADGPIAANVPAGFKSGPFGHPEARDILPSGAGNKAIALKNCRNVLLRDFSMLHGGHFAILATGTDNLTIENLTIDTNRDGMDIDACRNVRISRCSVNSFWDDGICLKASFALGENRATENVTISDCYVSGFVEGTLLDGTKVRNDAQQNHGPIGRIKLGTEANGGFRNIAIVNCVFEACRGLALEQVDGGVMEDIVISNITMRDIVNAPIFVRLGARLRAPQGTPMGSAQRISISHIMASNVAPGQGILVLGCPGYPIRDLDLSDIRIQYQGGGSVDQPGRTVPELERAYPEPYAFGILPSWAVFTRHVQGLRFRNFDFSVSSPDRRPAVLLDDVKDVDLSFIRLPPGADKNAWVFRAVAGDRRFRCDGLDQP
jgi:polygalacturonase